jgi:fructuronate reductase
VSRDPVNRIRGLSRATLAGVPAECRRHTTAPGLAAGIVHLGVGAFHRAHQAVFTEDAIAAAGGDWGISGIAPRSRQVLDRLAAQDLLYSVTSLSARSTTTRVVGVLTSLLHAPSDPGAVVGRIADPATRIVTLTVTEKGYRLDPVRGGLRTDDPEVLADLAGDRPPVTVPGMLVAGLVRRALAGGPPLAVLSCDNLSRNGRRLARVVQDALGLVPAPVAARARAWVEANVAFPCSMVDRVVPAQGDATRDRAAGALGVADLAALEAEPFRQWVVQDTFPAGRPAWELAGAELVEDVTAWEELKLRVLNGTHSTMAYLGALAGRATIEQALALPGMREFLWRLLLEDIVPTLEPPPGVDPVRYGEAVLERFANPMVVHRTLQVAMDGSQKLPQRLAPTIADRLRAGAEPRWAALALAGWMRFVTGRADDGAALPLDDPLAGPIRSAAGRSGSPRSLAGALLGLDQIFGAELRDSAALRALVVEWLGALEADGAAGVLAGFQDGRPSGRPGRGAGVRGAT